jgi:hypothetical protein
MACEADGFNSDVDLVKSCGLHEKHALATRTWGDISVLA